MTMRERMQEAVDPVSPYRTHPTAMTTRWEYAVVQLAATKWAGAGQRVRDTLGEMGHYGWELVKWDEGRGSGVGMRGAGADLVLIFKRPSA